MLSIKNSDLRLPMFASAILLSILKAVLVVLVAGVVIAKIVPAGAQAVDDNREDHSGPSAPTSSVENAQALIPIPLYVDPTAAESPPSQETAAPAIHSIASTDFYEPIGCKNPVDDYSAVEVGDRILNVRTMEMLRHAGQVYGGSIDLLAGAVISIEHPGKLHAVPDPHQDRGVLDISVRHPTANWILYEEIDNLVAALRTAGFAAWVRSSGELYPGSDIHIHAVAIGDRDLSGPALDQLYGKYGYFAGKKGYFDETSTMDPHGGPIICQWMRHSGLGDFHQMRSTTSQDIVDWQEKLRLAALSFVTTSQEETHQVARGLGFQGQGQEDPSNMCGPLSAAILQRAGLLPSASGPVTDLYNYWLADPLSNGRPWSLFPGDRYEVHRFTQAIERFDFSEWPLFPGDFVYTYSGHGAFSHMFVVTEVDSAGRMYTVTNQEQPQGGYWIERILLYDPQDLEAGVFRSTCEDCGSWRRRTGLGGFDVLRRTDLADLELASAGAMTLSTFGDYHSVSPSN